MKKILIIDDEEGVRDAFELALEDEGYEIETASTGEAGLEKARLRKPDLVFLDLKMPGISGVETMRRLHASHDGLQIYIVTGFYDEFMRGLEAARDEGLTFNLARKPLGQNEIRMIANSLLGDPIAIAG